MRGALWRGDLLRLARDVGPESARHAARLLGFEGHSSPDRSSSRTRASEDGASEEPVGEEVPRYESVSVPLLRVHRFDPIEPERGDDEPGDGGGGAESFVEPDQDLAAFLAQGAPGLNAAVDLNRKSAAGPPLEPWPRVWRWLRTSTRCPVERDEVDVDRAVHLLSRGDDLRRIPRRRRLRAARHLWVIIDRSRKLEPFWGDQDDVLRRLQRHYGPHGITVHLHLEGPRSQPVAPGGATRRPSDPPSSAPILLLGDLGGYGGAAEGREWAARGRELARLGYRLRALAPCPLARIIPGAGRAWNVRAWDRIHPRPARPQHHHRRSQPVERLLRLVSPAVRIEPGLLRAARMRLPAEAADVGTEYDAWTDARVRARSSVAMVLDADVAHGLRAGWAQEDEECRSDFVRLLESWHAPALPEVWAEEIIGLAALDPESIDPRQVEWAELLLSLAAGDITRGTSDSDALERWLVRAAPRLPDGIWTKPELGTKLVQAWRRAHRESVDARHPLGIGPEAISTYRFEPTRWTARQVGGVLELAPSRGPSKGADAHGGAEAAGSSWVADIWMSEPGVAAGGSGGTSGRKLDTNARTRFPIPRPDPSGSNGAPPWAVESGINSFGRWARAEIAGVSLRFRWIEPGTFFMGSPEDEWGRYDDEIRHEVELTQGFWLAETPCTQRLWIEVMGDRPGSSVGDEIPVTDVSWDEVQSFLERVGRDYGELRLPSEAEWEYACRGGTGRSTYAGDLNEANQAGVLDPIAWWSGSRVSSAQPVGLKASNPLGLFDMLGNVYEWCSDHVSDLRDLVDSGEERRVNPRGRAGRLRVIRGGSWLGHPQGVRAAYRFAGHPGYRNGGLGFRLARGQDLRSSPSSGEAARGAGRAADAELPRGTTSGHRWRTDLGSWSFDWIEKPAWAHAAGRDAFGLWATLKIGVVEQRMRWIAPGRFRMGSPDDEGGRFDREPLHEVAIRSGYWLAETPCTQALWAEVLAGDQPFRFHDPRLPVESVTFEDVQRFIWSLPGQGADGFEFRLPTEAEWEHACRAGVDRARYGELDDVAWHAGNSGRTTRPVGALRANPWGLHDMLGNVFEWCLDRVANYSDPPVLPGGSGLAVDPIETFGEQRVIRGGSWFDHPQYVRAAYRYADHPGRRSGDLGFRLARGQGVRPSQGKFKRDAERGAGRAAEASPGRTVD